MNHQNFLFVYEHLFTGGIETLILRLSRKLINDGHEVTFFLREKGELAEGIHNKVKIITEPDFNSLYNNLSSTKFRNEYELKDVDVIFSFNPISMLVASSFSHYLPNAKVITGVYHPRAYFYESYSRLRRLIYKRAFLDLHDSSIIFMNLDVKQHHQKALKKGYKQSKIFPLPLTLPKQVESLKIRNNCVYRIVSIGRFARFKTYNLYMLGVIDKLNENGFDTEYHIYGYGALEHEMISKISRLKCSDKIILKGKLNYSDFGEVVTNANLFIGMGTAVLEAASYGVPAIVAIENSKAAKTYGFVHMLDDFNCGEYIKGKEGVDVYEFIKNFLELSNEKKDMLSSESSDFTIKLGIDSLIHDFYNVIENIRPKSYKPNRFLQILFFISELKRQVIFKYKK